MLPDRSTIRSLVALDPAMARGRASPGGCLERATRKNLFCIRPFFSCWGRKATIMGRTILSKASRLQKTYATAAMAPFAHLRDQSPFRL